MDIVYTCQENYAQIAGISIYSLLKNNEKNHITIHFLDSGLTESSKSIYKSMCAKHNNAEIIFYNVLDLIEKYSEKLTAFQNNFATYAKLFMEMLLPKDLNSCLYIDSDTLVLGDLEKIGQLQIDSTLAMNYDLVFQEMKKSINFSNDEPYYNAGVIYVNLEKWRKNEYTEKIIDFIKSGKKIDFGDQDIFNYVFKNDIELLGLDYNYISQFFVYHSWWLCKSIFKINEKNFYNKEIYMKSCPKIIHFTYYPFVLRPWFSKSNHPFSKVYRNYVKDSPYGDTFIFHKIKQPIRRKIIQFLLGPNFNDIFVLFLGNVIHKLNKRKYEN